MENNAVKKRSKKVIHEKRKKQVPQVRLSKIGLHSLNILKTILDNQLKSYASQKATLC